MKLIFEYELVNNGWASILIKTRKEKLQFPVSCVLYDTFKLLVRATRKLLLNEPYIEIWSFSEPDVYAIQIVQKNDLQDTFSVKKYPTIQHIENGDVDLCFQATLNRIAIIYQFYHSIEYIRNTYTKEVYFNKSKLPFPTKEVIDLERLIKT